jgi:hypothetical protein
VTRGEDGKLYITISNSPRGKVRVAQEAVEAVPEVAVKAEPPATKVEAKKPWEMTRPEWVEEVKRGGTFLENDRAIKSMRGADRLDRAICPCEP